MRRCAEAFAEYEDCGDHCYGPIVDSQLEPWKVCFHLFPFHCLRLIAK
jgi:hypothetical protein